MKRIHLVLLAVVLGAAFVTGTAVAQYSKPILVGGENPAGKTGTQQTQSTSVLFFVHPKTPPGTQNFTNDTGRIDLSGQNPIFIDDVAGMPGYAGTNLVQPDSPMLDHPGFRTSPPLPGLPTLNGIGPDDLSLSVLRTSPSMSYSVVLGRDLLLEGRHPAGHRLLLGDIREDAQPPKGEFVALFGADPLEVGLIGNAGEVTPYDKYYPSTVIANNAAHPFRWCAVPEAALLIAGHSDTCGGTSNFLGQNKYEDAFLYGMADLGNGFVAASYDPLLLSTRGENYLKLNITVGGVSTTLAISQLMHQAISSAYFSPLAFFRKVDDGGITRYRFSGYTSWELPQLTVDRTVTPSKLKYNLWPLILTNWLVPVATNPIAATAVKYEGLSSTPQHPDADLAVAYQTTFFDLDQNVFDPMGRPAVFGDGAYHTLRELLGTCTPQPADSDKPCPSGAQFNALTPQDFPDRILSLAVIWSQMNKWNIGGDNGPYETMNPSHVVSPAASAIVGPGMYDMAVLHDFAADPDPAKRKEVLLVPSAIESGDAIVYAISEASRQLYFLSNGLARLVPPSGMSSGKPSCAQDPTRYPATGLLLPDILSLKRPADGFVPYQVRAGDLDGNACEDFIVTWRGKDTVKDTKTGGVKFDDGNGMSFAGRVSIVLRSDDGAGHCVATDAAHYPQGVPAFIDIPPTANATAKPQIASATIGDFNGDGVADIAVGNALTEKDGTDYTAFAYVVKGPNFSTLPQDMDRVRTGFAQSATDDFQQVNGVANISTDHPSAGPDALAQINGTPLALPKIGCPNYTDATNVDVQSIFGTYVSVITDKLAQFIASLPIGQGVLDTSKPPFADAQSHPMPPYCAAPAACVYNGTPLPLLATDPCCQNPCLTAAPNCYAYLRTYGYLFSCKLVDEINSACGIVQNGPAQGTEMYADAWQPDVVTGHDRHAIAEASALVPAQAMAPQNILQPLQPGTLNAAPAAQALPDIQIDGPGTMQISPADAAAAAPTEVLTLPYLPLRDVLAKTIESIGQSAAEATNAAGIVRTDDSFAELEQALNGTLVRAIWGPPQTLQGLFGGFIAGGFFVGAQAGAPVAAADGTATTKSQQTKGVFAGGCSLMGSVSLPGGIRLAAGGTLADGASCVSSDQCAVGICLNASAANPPPHTCYNYVDQTACGDGIVVLGEQCDTADGSCTGCGAPNCRCVGCQCQVSNVTVVTPISPGRIDQVPLGPAGPSAAVCGDSHITAPEECDPGALGIPNNGCVDPAKLHCCTQGDPTGCTPCTCTSGAYIRHPLQPVPAPYLPVPPVSPAPGPAGVRLPQGQAMPGHREMTAIVRKQSPVCNYNRQKDLPSEQCDIGTISMVPALTQAEKDALLAQQCTDTTQGKPVDCGMAACNCVYEQPQCVGRAGVQCSRTTDCPSGGICDVNCTCQTAQGPGTPATTDLLAKSYNDCEVHCDFDAGDTNKPYYDQLNADLRKATGRTDDLICEPEAGVTVLCKVAGGSAPGIAASSISLSLSGTPLPDSPDNVRPYALIQSGGSQFNDSSLLTYKDFTLVEQATRLLPVDQAAAQTVKAVILPDLSSSAELAPLAGAAPMASTSYRVETGGSELLNNMVEHRVYSVPAGQSLSAAVSGVGAQVVTQASEIPAGAAITMHEFKFKIPPDCGSWTGVEGYKGCPPIESRQLDLQKLTDSLKSKAQSVQPVSAAIAVGLPWEANLNYQFSLAQSVYGKAGTTEPTPAALQFGFLAAPTGLGKGGGGCSCNVSSVEPTLASVLPMLLGVLVPIGGIAVGRVRRRRFTSHE